MDGPYLREEVIPPGELCTVFNGPPGVRVDLPVTDPSEAVLVRRDHLILFVLSDPTGPIGSWCFEGQNSPFTTRFFGPFPDESSACAYSNSLPTV